MAQTREFVLGMLMGAAVGAAVAILYAPHSGPQTRDLLKEKAAAVKEKTATAVDTAKSKAREVTGNVSTSAQQLVEKSRSKVEAQVSAVQAAVEAGKQEFQKKQAELTQEVREDLSGAVTSETPSV